MSSRIVGSWWSCVRRRRSGAECAPVLLKRWGRRCGLGIFAVGVFQPKEGGLLPVATLFLMDVIEVPGVEGLEPFVPADVAELIAVAAKVGLQHPQVVPPP